MADTSRARFLFDEILAKKDQAFGHLATFVNGGDAVAENGWRDYKEAGFLGKTPKQDKEREDIKRIWSENLSAFANTSGGIVLWGFHTDGKIPDKLSLAPNCEWLAGWLRDLVKDATDPYVAGVEVHAAKESDTSTAGFVICHVPPSNFALHQALWGERAYFIRTQDSNIVCPQPLLRNMFYPRILAHLEPIVRMTALAHQDGSIRVRLEARVRSLGPATAEVAIIQLEPRDLISPWVDPDHNWEVIAPNVVKYRHPLPPNFKPPHVIGINGILTSNGASVVFRFFTHNTPAHHATVAFSNDEVLNCLRSGTHLERPGQSNPMFP